MSSLEEVAQLAGVSPSTVSRALSRPDMVAAATRERILAAVAHTGYLPNELARSLVRQESRSIGLVVTDLNPFHAALAKGVQDTAEREDLNVILFTSDESEARERRALETLRSYQPLGLILTPSVHTAGHQHLLRGLPVVEVDRCSGLPGVHSVNVDNVGSTQQAVAYLLGLGHRRVAGIFGPPEIDTGARRLDGFLQAMARAGLDVNPAWTPSGPFSEGTGFQLAMALLDCGAAQRPTALFVGSLELTVGAIRAVQQLGLRLPDDLSLLGFDDARIMTVVQPSVTVVSQPSYRLGAQACLTLIRQIRQPEPGAARRVALPTELIVRQSTGPPPGA